MQSNYFVNIKALEKDNYVIIYDLPDKSCKIIY